MSSVLCRIVTYVSLKLPFGEIWTIPMCRVGIYGSVSGSPILAINHHYDEKRVPIDVQ